MYTEKMSIYFKQLNILFYIFLLKSFNITAAASIYYNDHNSLDVGDKDIKDYWDNDEPNPNERSNNDDNYGRGCKPYPMTTTCPSTTNNCNRPGNEKPNGKETEDVVEHVIKILRCMREHAIALIRNMNELEMDILSSPSTSNSGGHCKSATNAINDNLNGIEKLIYPDVLSQTPGYVINEWAVPIQTESLHEDEQTNGFVSEAQEAVRSWKQQIETCKHILDNAVHNALRAANVKSPIGVEDSKTVENNYPNVPSYSKASPIANDLVQLKDYKEDKEKTQNARSNKKRKYHGLYDAFRAKDEDY